MSWSDDAWSTITDIYDRILHLPFLTEMAMGTLPRPTFDFYIRQDDLYLDDYTRVLAHIASRLQDLAHVETFLGFAANAVAMERGMHAQYVSDSASEKTPECELYSSFLKAQAYENVAVEAASILPCFWVYQRVGEHVLATARMEGNPYAAWIEAYSDPSFDEGTRRCLEIVNSLADSASEQTRRQMTHVFRQATRMEWLFWDSAYRHSQWPV